MAVDEQLLVRAKSEHRIVAHFVTGSEIPLNPPLAKGETKIVPFAKGGRAPARGDFVRHCAKPVWSDLGVTREGWHSRR